jgi:[CysO sulfur-carrier protein]-S-L-cysteine hydrolase
VDGPALFRLLEEIEGGGEGLGAIYHSHTRSEPYPSQTDVNFSGGWPGVEWIIVGLRGAEPEVRSYTIDDGDVREVALEVE